MYYFSHGNKERLKALDIYGQWSNGTWENVIKYNDNVVVMIDENKPTRPLDPYEDFKNKFAENKFSWHDRSIWIAMSKWGEVGNFLLIERMLSKTHIKILEKHFQYVRIAYWQKRDLTPELAARE